MRSARLQRDPLVATRQGEGVATQRDADLPGLSPPRAAVCEQSRHPARREDGNHGVLGGRAAPERLKATSRRLGRRASGRQRRRHASVVRVKPLHLMPVKGGINSLLFQELEAGTCADLREFRCVRSRLISAFSSNLHCAAAEPTCSAQNQR